jgi:hypothetical protein
MARALLVADENVLDVFLLEDLVVDRQNSAAGIAEYMFDPVIPQRLQDDLRACHCHLVARHDPWSFPSVARA